jgi:hypothetical protein
MKMGVGAWGAPFMKFTLTYDGPLPASANKPKNQDKWDIRLRIDPQLRDLWASHPALRFADDNRHFPKYGGAALTQVHHLHPGPVTPIRTIERANKEIIDLCEPIEKHGAWFRPLVRESYALHCGLNITFLRQEGPGKVYQGGDLDGRIKTLLDALAMPQHREQILGISTKFVPILQSERLLGSEANAPDHVRLNIEVDVRVRQATVYNQSFLG